jgi:hypothetical protein
MPIVNGQWVNDYSQFSPSGYSPYVGAGFNANPYGYAPNVPAYSPTLSFNPQVSANPNSMSQQAFNSATPASPDTAGGGGGASSGDGEEGEGSKFNPIGFGLGAIQAGVGLYQLNKLSKTPQPEYTASKGTLAANQRAQQMSQMGYTPSQTAAYKANLGTALNTQFLNQRNLAGGNLAGALGARGSMQKFSALNQFAAGDADRQMGNIRYADEQTAGLQRMQNMNTEAAMRRRLMTEQALGAAVQQGTVNMAGAFDTGASFAKFASMMG